MNKYKSRGFSRGFCEIRSFENNPLDPLCFRTRNGTKLRFPELCAHKRACLDVSFCRRPPYKMKEWWEKQKENNFEGFEGCDELKRFVDEIRKADYHGRKFSPLENFYNEWRNRFFKKYYNLLNLSDKGKERLPLKLFMDTITPVLSMILPVIVTQRNDSDLFDVHILLGYRHTSTENNYDDFYTVFGGWNFIMPIANKKCQTPYLNLYDENSCESATRFLVESLSARKLSKVLINEDVEKGFYPNKVVDIISRKYVFGGRSYHLPVSIHTFLVPVVELDLSWKSSLFDNVLAEENRGKWLKFSNFGLLKVTDELFKTLRYNDEFEKSDFVYGDGFFQMKSMKKMESYQRRLEEYPPVEIKGKLKFCEGDFDDARTGMKLKDIGGAENVKYRDWDFSGVSETMRNGKYMIESPSILKILAFEDELKDMIKVGLKNFRSAAKVEF